LSGSPGAILIKGDRKGSSISGKKGTEFLRLIEALCTTALAPL